jgi:ribosome biogenesis GTPase / thiamine phosphate phosphatase
MPITITSLNAEPDELRDMLAGRVSALVGHSGVGKSTLVNKLVPDAERATGEVSGVGKGRHTSTSAVALALPGAGWVVDTPGIRSFGLAHVTADDVIAPFEGFAEAAEECPPNCGHLGGTDDPDCYLDTYTEKEGGSPDQLASLRRLLRSRAGLDEA